MATIEEVTDLINSVVRVMSTEFEESLKTIHASIRELQPPRLEPYAPVSINPNVQSNNTSLDLIKSVPEFKGNSNEYPAWREAAHFAINYYTEGSENYYISMGILRNKIGGSANIALASFNTVLNFKAIIERLDQSYSDKRPSHVLEYELSILRQGDLSLQEFYNSVDKQLTLIVNKIKMSSDNNPHIICALNDRARQNALRVFISGLRRPLCDILFSSNPNDLPSALAIAQELEYNQKRNDFARVFANNNKPERQHIIKPQNFNSYKAPQDRPRNNIPDLTKIINPQHTPTPSDSNGFPVPMEVDPSSSIFKRSTIQSGNRTHQIPRQNNVNTNANINQEHIRSIRHTPFFPTKIQTVNHLPVESVDDSETTFCNLENETSEKNYDSDNTNDQAINFLD